MSSGPVIIMTSLEATAAQPGRTSALEAAGAIIEAGDGSVTTALAALRTREVSSMLVEGGAVLHAALWQAGVVDRVHLITAPRALGLEGVPLFGGATGGTARVTPVAASLVGADTWVEADVHWSH